MFKFLGQLLRAFIGIPTAICVTAVVGTFGFFAFLYAASQDHFVKTAHGKKNVHTDAGAEALNDAIKGIISWCWSAALPVVFENASDVGLYASKEKSFEGRPGIPGGRKFKIPKPESERKKEAIAAKAKSIPKVFSDKGVAVPEGKDLKSPEGKKLSKSKNKTPDIAPAA